MKTLLAICLAVSLAVLFPNLGCAVPLTGAGNACGDPCASRSCPSAFICTVDSHCGARCQPEPVKPGMP